MDFFALSYGMTVTHGNDELEVAKHSGSNWITVRMLTNEQPNGEITLRSKDQAEHLRLMLDQIIGRRT